MHTTLDVGFDEQEAKPVSGETALPVVPLTWYLPRWFVYMVARARDRRASGARKRGANERLLARIEQGSYRPTDVADFLLLLGRAWYFMTGISLFFEILLIALTAAFGVIDKILWLIGLAGSLYPGLLSFGLIFYLHSVALAHYAEDGDTSSFIEANFLLPRKRNMLIVPMVAILGLVVFGLNTNWYRG